MNFLEARRLVNAFQGGPPLPFLFALSGTAEPFALYLQAAAAQRGHAADARFLPFNTLAQALRVDPDPLITEVFLLVPWDFTPEADWRLGVPEAVDPEALRARAAETASLLTRRPQARLLYLPAPLPPLFPDPTRGAEFARSLESLALGLGARALPADAFSLGGYLSSGCPVGGTWIGTVAQAVIEAAAAGRPEPKKVLVTDLDNVLWHGLIAEEGPEGIACEPSGRGYRHFIYQGLLRRLRGEGTVLAAVSRNDPDIVLPPFRSGRLLLREDDFVAIIAGYHAKSAQIRELAQRLNELMRRIFLARGWLGVGLLSLGLILPAIAVASPSSARKRYESGKYESALREYKRKALHFHLDTRRPEIVRPERGEGGPGRRASLADTVRDKLRSRPITENIDREALVELGLHYLREADLVAGPAGEESVA